MRFAPLSFLAFFLACSNDNFDSKDAGDAGGGDQSIPTVEGGGVDADAQMPTPRRVFVANFDTTGVSAIAIWDNADTLAQDRAPDVLLNAGMTKPSALGLAGTRLFVWDDGASKLNAFDGASSIVGTSTPTASLGAAAFLGNGTPHVYNLTVSNPGDLLFATDPFVMSTAVQMFTNASTLTSSAVAKAQFGQTNEGFFAVARDPMDRLFLGELPQQVIKYTTGASTKSGAVSLTMDFGAPTMLIQCMQTDGVRLYAGGAVQGGAASVFIYDLSGIQPGSTPNVTLNNANGIPGTGIVTEMALANDVLVVTNGQQVISFSGAKTITAGAQGTLLTSDAMMVQRIRLSPKTGLLYTVGKYKGSSGLQVWKSPASVPALQAEVRSGIGASPWDVALYEP